MLKKHIERVVRFPWTTILLSVFVTVFFAAQFKNLFMVLDPKAILPQGHPYVQLNNEIEQRFGGSRVVVIGIHSKDGDIFNVQDIERIRRITEAVKKAPGILESNVVSITDHKVKYVEAAGDNLKIVGLDEGVQNTPEGMAELKRRVFSNPMFVDSLVSKDGTAAAIITDFKGGAGDWWSKQAKKQDAASGSPSSQDTTGTTTPTSEKKDWPQGAATYPDGSAKQVSPDGTDKDVSAGSATPSGSEGGPRPSGQYGQGNWNFGDQAGKGGWPAGGDSKSVEQWYVSDATIHKKLLDIVNKEKDAQTEIYLGGLPVALSFLEADSLRMTQVVYPLAVLLIMGVLYFAFRSIQGMLLPILCAFLSVIWAVGMMGLLHIPLDPWNMMTPILILAVAAGHSVQILKRYYEELQRADAAGGHGSAFTVGDSKLAVITSLTKIGPVMITAGLVAAASFASLITFELKSFQSFGLFTAFGILSAVILEMTFIPAARAVIRPKRLASTARATSDATPPQGLDAFMLSISRLTQERKVWVWAGTAAVIVVALLGINQLTVQNSLKNLFFESTPLRQDEKALNQSFGGTATFYVYLEGSAADSLKDPNILKAVEGLQRELEKMPEVGKTQSFVDYIKTVNQSLHGGDTAFRVVPEERSTIGEFLFLFSISGSQGELDRLIDYEYRRAVIWVYLRDDSTALGEKLVALVRDYSRKNLPGSTFIGQEAVGTAPAAQAGQTLKVGVAGSIPVMMALNQTMVDGKIKNILQIAVIVLILSALAFRSLLAGLFVLVPLVFAVLVNFGILGWLGIGLGIGTAAISAMVVGFGADYAIYLLSRIREENQAGESVRAVMDRSLRTAGPAIIFVALAISVGGLTLLFTGYYIHMEGFLIPLAMLSSSAAALILLPALSAAWKPKFLSRL